jgi:hypothetical protein
MEAPPTPPGRPGRPTPAGTIAADSWLAAHAAPIVAVRPPRLRAFWAARLRQDRRLDCRRSIALFCRFGLTSSGHLMSVVGVVIGAVAVSTSVCVLSPLRKRTEMLSWLRRRRETAERIDAEADALIGELGVEAYAEARRREYESSGDATALWRLLKRIGLDTSTRSAMNTIFAPDREPREKRNPQLFSRLDELKATLSLQPLRLQFINSVPDRGPSIVTEVEIQASYESGAIVAAAEIAMPPRTIGLRILDTEGREVFSRRRGDRSRKHK